jgi:hypothetical protein
MTHRIRLAAVGGTEQCKQSYRKNVAQFAVISNFLMNATAMHSMVYKRGANIDRKWCYMDLRGGLNTPNIATVCAIAYLLAVVDTAHIHSDKYTVRLYNAVQQWTTPC